MAFAQMSSDAAQATEPKRETLRVVSKSIERDRAGPTGEQFQSFERALPARLDLLTRVATKFSRQVAADREYGPDRFKSLMLQAHAAPSSVLEALLAKSATIEQLGEGLSRASTSLSGKALGDDRNLIFYPSDPCRIADSRSSTGGKLSTNVARGYRNWAAPGQGGAAGRNLGTGGILTGSKGAIAMTVTVTGADGPGYLTLRPAGSTALTSAINFTAGQDLANSTVVQMTGLGLDQPDFEIVPAVFAGAGQIHVVLDVLGFYVAAEPTPLECESVSANAAGTASSGYKQMTAPSCTAGFNRTGLYCSTGASSGTSLISTGFGGTQCEWQQTATSSINYTATSRCCRVPGQTSAFIP